MQKQWLVLPKINEEVKNQFPEINPLVLQLLYNRNLKTQEEIDEFLTPDYSRDLHSPFLFSQMEKSVERIFQALEKKEKVLVYGDYDADGICSAIVMSETLKNLGINAEAYLPHREKEGHGLEKNVIKKFAQEKFNLIITVDCGISNAAEITLAKELGIDVIITDHHCQPPDLPLDAFTIINPKMTDEQYPFKGLAGVGVVFKFVQAIIQWQKNKLSQEILNESWEKWLLDLVAIGTVADLMPLIGENRTLVKYGLVVLNKTKRIGLKILLQKSGFDLNNLNTYNIAFQIGPRLNAAGRLDHANISLKLLTSQLEEEAEEIADRLNKINQKRQKMIDEVVNEINEKMEKTCFEEKVIFVVGENWPVGIIGLLAGKLKEALYKPIIVMTKVGDKLMGSGRSIAEFDIIEALEQVKDYFENFGGHRTACGFVFKDKEKLVAFQKDLQKIADEKLKDIILKPRLLIDSEIDLIDINWELYENLEKFEPFGQYNEQPKFLLKNVQLTSMQKVGVNGNHLRLLLGKGFTQMKKFIGFNLSNPWAETIKVGDKIDVVFELSVNSWNGTKELQMKIVDLKLSN